MDGFEGRGLVVRRVGSGTFVNFSGPIATSAGDVVDLISPLQLIEVRLAVEPSMARLATIHASSKDLDQMGAVLAELDACGADQDRFTRLDSDFHLALARCSRNPLMLHIYREINDVRTHAQWDRMKTVILNPEIIALYNLQHRAILDAMARRDVAGAVAAISRHLRPPASI